MTPQERQARSLAQAECNVREASRIAARTLAIIGILLTFWIILTFAVTVAFLVGRASATPPSHLGHISERLFADVTPAPRSAIHARAERLAFLSSGAERVTTVHDWRSGAPTPTAATPIPDPTVLSGDAAPSVGLSADRSAPRRSQGTASWYPADGLIAAVHSWTWGDDPYAVGVCTAIAGTSRCVTVMVSDYCDGCIGPRLIDLSDDAFRQLGPLSAGILRVEVSRP